MQFKLLAFSKPYFSLTWKIDPAEVESTIKYWLDSNQGIEIVTIRHDAVTSFWYPTQLFVSIYYRQQEASDAVRVI